MDKYPVSDEIRDQIVKSQMILDETHVAMGGTGKRVFELERRIAPLEANLAAARESYQNCVKDYNTVVDENTKLRIDLALVTAEKERTAKNWQDLNELTEQYFARTTVPKLERHPSMLVQMMAAHILKVTAERDALLALLIRYRNEIPLWHQPHMIAHLVDAAIDAARKEQT